MKSLPRTVAVFKSFLLFHQLVWLYPEIPTVTRGRACERTTLAPGLMYDHSKIHSYMDTTIIMEGAGRIEWANGCCLTTRADYQVTHDWSTRFFCRVRRVILPRTILNDMGNCHIIDKHYVAALPDCNAGLRELC